MLSRIERGIVSASLTTLARIAAALDIDIEELVANRLLPESFVVAPAGSGSTLHVLHETAALRQVGQLSARMITLRATVLTVDAEAPHRSTPFGEGVVFTSVLAGAALCELGDRQIELAVGDGLFSSNRTPRWSALGEGARAQLLIVEALHG